MVISIDHGNKQIKTVHKVFVSGLVESDVRPALGEEYILYNNRYYSLTGHCLAYRRDKSKDESFFLLTLFGVAYEILATGEYTPGQTTTVDLLIGLPPAHYGAQYHDFETYFNRCVVKFSLGSKPFSVYFNSVTAYPQAYAAAMTVFSQLRPLSKCVVLDIGGFTADYMLLKYGVPDLSDCSSLEYGVILLYNRIINAVNSAYDLLLEEFDVDSVLAGRNSTLPDNVQKLLRDQARLFVEELFGQLRERMIDLRVTMPVFVGGGSILLRSYLEQAGRWSNCLFVDDIQANAKGYERIYRARLASKGHA